MDPATIKTLFDLGGPAAVAILAMMWLRAAYQERLSDVKDQRLAEQGRSDRLSSALEGNTKALTETVETIRSLRDEVQTCPLRSAVEAGGQVKVLRPRPIAAGR